MTLSEELQWRGFVQQSTITDLKSLDDKKIVFYSGFDASADSQTIGNLAFMMMNLLFIRHGHKAIILAGGATSLIGDPGGKDEERKMQDAQTISVNVENAKKQIQRIFGEYEFILVNNIDWTKDITVLEFLRDIGKYFSMTPLIQRDYIAKRIGEGGAGISYTEFSYTLLQGMDYLYLFDNYGVTLQLGGSDQWGNCLSGVDLIRRKRNASVDVITIPLIINQATGKKFGKSEEGAVWLDENKTSVFKFYQFWLNVDDEGVQYYLKLYTTLDKPEIDRIISEHESQPHLRIAQKRLAYEVTKTVHTAQRAESVKKISEILFGEKPIETLDGEDFEILGSEIGIHQVSSTDSVVDILVTSKLNASKSEARRNITQKSISINGSIVQDPNAAINSIEAISGYHLLKFGKNRMTVLRHSD